jgi:transposase
MLITHWANIITYFRHHLCNAAAEGLNSRIQQLIQKACGAVDPGFETRGMIM